MTNQELEAIIREEIEVVLEKKSSGSKSLKIWFGQDKDGAGPGKGGGWVDCNTCRKTKGGRKKCKACGRQKGEKRKYPRCRPTPGECSKRGNWGKKSKKANKDKK